MLKRILEKKKYDMENCGASRGFGFIYIYIYKKANKFPLSS